MMDVTKARKLAQGWLNSNIKPPDGDALVIIEDEVIEVDEGWYFLFQSEKFLKTGDINYSVVGNWPIFVERGGYVQGSKRPDGW
jgi:hypothetical protein